MLDSRYFEKGHLRVDTFRLLDVGEPSAGGWEQILTHLDDCPACMDQYLNALTEETLLELPEGMEERLICAVQEEYSRWKGSKIVFVKVTKLAVAVCLTMVLFAGGVFDFLGKAPRMIETRQIRTEQAVPVREEPSKEESSRREKRNDWLSDLNSGFISFAKTLHGFSR